MIQLVVVIVVSVVVLQNRCDTEHPLNIGVIYMVWMKTVLKYSLGKGEGCHLKEQKRKEESDMQI